MFDKPTHYKTLVVKTKEEDMDFYCFDEKIIEDLKESDEIFFYFRLSKETQMDKYSGNSVVSLLIEYIYKNPEMLKFFLI